MTHKVNDKFKQSIIDNAYQMTSSDLESKPMRVFDLTKTTDPVAKQELISQALAQAFRALEIQMSARAENRKRQVRGKPNETSMTPT
jgi:hypothetical protein